MNRFVTKSIAGWGNLPVQTCNLFRAEKRRDLLLALRDGKQPSYISRGLGRSYGDSSLNENQGVILNQRLNRFIAFDPTSGTLHCEAGVSLQEVLDIFVPRGFFPAVTPGTKYVTVGGAIAADVHGKNHHYDGCISEFVDAFTLLTACGDILNCSRGENPDAFWATIGGMGLTGIILDVTMRLRPIESAYVTVDYQKAPDLDAALAAFSKGDEHYRYSVAWIDCLASGAALGRSVLMRGNTAGVEDLPVQQRAEPLRFHARRRKSVPFNMPGFALNRLSVKAFNALFYRRHSDARRIVDYDEFFYPLDSIYHWNRMYGRRGFVQYQAVFPTESSRAGLVQLLETISASKLASFLAVLKSFGPQNQGMLSFPRAGSTLALDLPNKGARLTELLDRLDKIVLDHGGRLYLAKDSRMSAEMFRRMYPRLDEFRQVKAKLDPQNQFSSSQARRIGLVEASA
jgi:FAD/FMN-containing dehydrogenase